MSLWCVSADLQLDIHARLSTLTESGLTSRLRDFIACLDWIAGSAVKARCEGLILIGDIFDSRTKLDISVIDQTCRALHRWSDKLELVIVVGNHDSMLRTPQYNSLQVFNGYATVVEEPWLCTRGGKKFLFVPWYDDPAELAKQIKEQQKKHTPHYLFTHILCEGAVPVKGKGFPVKDLLPKKFTRIFLGDVHDPMQLAPNVQYVGAPLQIDYRDAGGTRGVWMLDTASDQLQFIENTISPRFHVIEDATVEGIRANDFVRIKTDDPGIAAEALAAVRGKAHYVETTFVPEDDHEVRLDVRTDQQEADVLRRFVEHQGLQGVDSLVTLGLDLLEEAKAEL